MPLPRSYCSKPNSDYHQWNNGFVDDATLARWNPENDSIFIRGVMVYGFYFVDDRGIGKKWNCKTGWEEKGML